jgi:hypothetical protein
MSGLVTLRGNCSDLRDLRVVLHLRLRLSLFLLNVYLVRGLLWLLGVRDWFLAVVELLAASLHLHAYLLVSLNPVHHFLPVLAGHLTELNNYALA